MGPLETFIAAAIEESIAIAGEPVRIAVLADQHDRWLTKTEIAAEDAGLEFERHSTSLGTECFAFKPGAKQGNQPEWAITLVPVR